MKAKPRNGRGRPLPKHVDILGIRVRVVRRTEARDKRLKGCWGYFCREEALIVVDTRCVNDHAWYVLRHEMAHAYIHYSGCWFTIGTVLSNLGVTDPGALEFLEEVIIREAMVPHAAGVAAQATPRS